MTAYTFTPPSEAHPMVVQDTGVRQRMFQAWSLFQVRQGRQVRQQWLADEVAKRLGMETMSQAAVSRWLKGSVPELRTMAAIADALGVDPGWLAFGPLSAAPAPRDPLREAVDAVNGVEA